MRQNEWVALPSLRRRAALQAGRLEFDTYRVEIRALLEEAGAIFAAWRDDPRQVARCDLLLRQAALCRRHAMDCLFRACRAPSA